MTYQEAKKNLTDAGYAGEPTPEAIKAAGWDADASIQESKAIGASDPTYTPEQMGVAAGALHEEMKANNLPANIMKGVKTLIGGVAQAGLILVMLTVMAGCSSKVAQQHNNDIEILATSYAAKTAKRQAAQIADYRREARAEADALTDTAIEAEKKRTDASTAEIAGNCVALMKIKADHYAAIEANCIKLQNDFNSDRSDVIQLTKKTSELREYFKGQNDTGELVKETSKILIDTLGAFKNGKQPSGK